VRQRKRRLLILYSGVQREEIETTYKFDENINVYRQILKISQELSERTAAQYLTAHYLAGNVVALMCFWKTKPRFVTVTLILLCGSLQKKSPTKVSGLRRVENLF
jgi:hypothetical protein